MATKVFYAKEMEGLKKLTKERRHEIQEAMMEVRYMHHLPPRVWCMHFILHASHYACVRCSQVLREHDLQGRVLVRTLHESEMPKEMLPLSSFKQQEEKV